MQIHELPTGNIEDGNKLPFDTGTNTYATSFTALATAVVNKTFSALTTTAKTVLEAINELNNNITWKTSASLEKTGANNAVSLSGITYSELMIVVKINNTTNIETFYVNKEILVFGGCWIRQGGYGATIATGGIVTIYVSTGAASITNVVLGTTDYGSTSVIKVYYR